MDAVEAFYLQFFLILMFFKIDLLNIDVLNIEYPIEYSIWSIEALEAGAGGEADTRLKVLLDFFSNGSSNYHPLLLNNNTTNTKTTGIPSSFAQSVHIHTHYTTNNKACKV